MKKILLYVTLFTVIIIAAAAVIIKTMPYLASSNHAIGDLLLPKIDEIDKITINFDKQRIKLRKDNGAWKINGYYAYNNLIDEFLHNLSQATYADEADALPENAIEIRLGIEEATFIFRAAATENENQTLIELNGKKWLINGNLLMPRDVSDYYVQPLLPLGGHPHEQSIGLIDDKVDLQNLRYYKASNALPEETYDYRSFAIVTADGIKVLGGLYKFEKEYWMSVQLKTTIMPTVETDKYVKENSFRFEKWYFLLSNSDGSRLYKSMQKN